MTFPISPVENETAVIDGTTYIYSTSSNSWTIVSAFIDGTTEIFQVTNPTGSTSSTTGALIVSGGVGINENLYVGKAIYENGLRVVTTASINQYANQTTIIAGTDTAISTSTGNITIWNTSTLQSVTGRGNSTTNAIVITNTASSTSTNSGALTVVGGVGIGGDVRIGGQIYGANGQAINANSSGTTSTFFINNTTTSTSTNSGALTVAGGVGIGGDLRIAGQIFGANGQAINASNSGTTSTFFINNSTTSTSTITGALTVVGGVGIGKDLYVGGQIFGPDGQAINAHNTGTTSTFLISNTASSTSTSSGALVVKGGAGIGENLYVGGNIQVTGSITLNGFQLGLGFWGSKGYAGSKGVDGFTGSQGSGFTGSASTASGYIGSTGFTGSAGPQGAAVNILGSTSSYTLLPGSYGGARGDSYIDTPTGNLWIWNGASWSNAGKIVGPQGNTGFLGSFGFTGSASTASGYTGSRGLDGAYAGIGYTGSQGDLGDKGDPGDLGFTGSSGFTGSASTASGYIGSDGYTGSIGFTGSTGFTGSQGPQGEPGTAAFRGYTGSASTATGYTGSLGYYGSKGGFDSVQTITTQTGTNYTLAIADAGTLINFNNPVGTNVTILPDSYVNFTVGQRIDIAQVGIGYVSVVQFLGVTLHIPDNTSAYLSNQYSLATLIKIAPNEWTYIGPATSVAGYQGSVGYTGSASTASGFTGSKGGFDSVQVISTQTGTSYSLVLSDAGKFIEFTNNSTISVIILPDSLVNFSVGQRIDLCKAGAGTVNIGAYLGVTLYSTEAASLTVDYSVGTLIKIAENVWTFLGPAASVTGPIGYTGSRGVTGYWGSTGYTGSGGYTGSTGTQGITGFWGSVGYVGSLGYTGSTGTQGIIGFTGSLGYIGSTGYTGSTGTQGITGFWGSRGYAGSIGLIGFTGSIGPVGLPGDPGNTGFWGSRGYAGSSGYTGSGGSGYTGSASTASGFTGSNGYTGSEGNPGSSISILGAVSTSTSLPGYPTSYTGAIGDGYVTSVDGYLWIWNGTQWNSITRVVGPQGVIGYTGSRGASGAAVDRGYTGSAAYTPFDGSAIFNITNTTSSTSTTTGALVVSGGVGIGKDLYVGGTIYQNGTAVGTGGGGTASTTTLVAQVYTPGSLFTGYSSLYTAKWFPNRAITITGITARVLSSGTQAVSLNINVDDSTVSTISFLGLGPAYASNTPISIASSTSNVTVIITNTGAYAADLYVSINYNNT